jgi:hypothetical protein
MDNTGSMHPAIVELRRRMDETVNRLLMSNSEIKISLILFGDYCDTPYSNGFCRVLPLTNKTLDILEFVKDIRADGGGDAPEAYEYALYQANQLKWEDDAVKVCVVVGDEVAHDRMYAKTAIGLDLDWTEQARKLSQKNVNIYSVQALGKKANTAFYMNLADIGNGYQLTLDQFSHIPETVEAIGYKQNGDDVLIKFQTELENAGKLNRSLAATVNALLGKKTAKYKFDTDLNAVPQSRFQVLNVDNKVDIKSFVEYSGANFAKGRGFYQLTKPEDVQGYKEVVLQHKITGDLFNGVKARELVGLPINGDNAHIRPVFLKDYNVFIQSTSNNRKLMPKTLFLYEVE